MSILTIKKTDFFNPFQIKALNLHSQNCNVILRTDYVKQRENYSGRRFAEC